MADWIIIVDDDSVNLKMAGRILSEYGMRVTALKSGSAFLKYVRENGTPDIVLLDIRMPEMDGFETLTQFRMLEQDQGFIETPVVFLTADEDKDSEMRGFRMGVSDFIHKPFDPDILIQRIVNIIASSKKLQSVEQKAAHDLLTGFYNKEATRDKLSIMCARKSGALLMIDLDSFKLVNDIYGHDMGDKVLISFANIMKNLSEPNGTCGRIGGDEFMMFFAGLQDESGVADFSSKLNSRLLESAYELMGEDMHIPLGASVGAVFVPEQGTDFENLFNMADQALYIVKDNGKHGYFVNRGGRTSNETESGSDIDLKTMSKLLEERGAATNVMWLGQDEFGSVYRYMMRILERYGIYAHKALFTIRRKSEDISDEIKDKMADSLREVIQSNLRNSDIMVRVGMDRFFLLLPELTPEHVERVTARIKGAWSNLKFGNDAEVICEYESISPSGDKVKAATDIDAERIVIVDDDGTNLMVAERIIRKEGMEVKCLKSGKELLDYLSSNYADLVLLDIKMPEMDGFETMQKLTSMGGRASKIPVIFLTASDDNETEAKGFSLGAMDFIRKPFIPEILIMRVKHAIRLIRLQNRLRSEVNEEVKKNEELSIHIIQALAAAVDAKDIYTRGHSERVANYSRMIAEEIGYDENACNNIYIMGLLHDVGKIGIPDEIINKKGTLTDEEYEIIKTHTTKGANILDSIPEMPGLRTGAKWHHERYDGTGYPDGLSGKDIPEEARIIAVADSYDAMTSRRSYRDALPQQAVRSELENGMGTQFDPRFARIMIDKIDADKDYLMREV